MFIFIWNKRSVGGYLYFKSNLHAFINALRIIEIKRHVQSKPGWEESPNYSPWKVLMWVNEGLLFSYGWAMWSLCPFLRSKLPITSRFLSSYVTFWVLCRLHCLKMLTFQRLMYLIIAIKARSKLSHTIIGSPFPGKLGSQPPPPVTGRPCAAMILTSNGGFYRERKTVENITSKVRGGGVSNKTEFSVECIFSYKDYQPSEFGNAGFPRTKV